MGEDYKLKNKAVLDNIYSIKSKFKILLSEAEDIRVIEAASMIEKLDLATVVLVGNREKINELIEESQLTINSNILDPKKTFSKKIAELANLLYEKRKHKGMTQKDAENLILNDTKYFSAAMVEAGDYDAYIAGNICSSANTIKPAIYLLGKAKTYASSHFLMLTNKGPLLFADCAFNVNPSSEDLAKIAIQTARSASAYGLTPKIAFLSHSTKGSAKNPDQKKVADAVKLFENYNEGYDYDGEMQIDAALISQIGQKKNPGSKVAGYANVLIFPDLDAANIGYKLVQRFSGAKAIGPVIQGLNKEAHDLSRGCSSEDIVDLVAITCNRLENKN